MRRTAATRSPINPRHRPRRVPLRDLVSYNEKHNEANRGEPLRTRDNRSESRRRGPTDDPAVPARARQQRNSLATLFSGVPMLLAATVLTQGRQQQRSRNEISWFDWDSADGRCRFARRVIAL
jgi:glycogen operon protein